MIYSDGIHLISSVSREELDNFCAKIGIKKCWFHYGSRFEHYDIPKKMRESFFRCYPEVKKVTPREIYSILKEQRGMGLK